MIRTINSLLRQQRKAAVFINSSYEIVYTNELAVQIADTSEVLTFKDNKFEYSSNVDAVLFRQAVKISSEQSRYKTLYFDDFSIKHPLRVDIIPILDDLIVFTQNEVKTIVLLDSVNLKQNDLDNKFKDKYSLTPSEFDLTTQLLDGKSLNGCAKISKRKVSTLRWTLGNIFTKTATNTQRELISLARLFY